MEEDRLVKIITEGAQIYLNKQLKLLEQFAAIDCGTGDEGGNKKIVSLLIKELEQIGANCQTIYVPGVGTHVVARIKPEYPKGKVIINAHLDTVFHPGDVKQHPFRIKDDWAWGLGVADCKGGVATSIYAVRIMKDAGMLPNKELVMIYNCDEETGSQSAREIFEQEAKDAECAFVFEPARNKNGIITKRRGQAFVTIQVDGIEAHAALEPQRGASATLELAYVIWKLHRMGDNAKKMLYNIGRMGGAETSLVVAGHAWCEAAVSLEGPETLKQIQEEMQNLKKNVEIPGCRISTKLKVLFPAQRRTCGNVRLYELVKKAGEQMEIELPEEESAGPSDACYFSTFGIPTVDAMGPYMRDIHTVNERMYIPSLLERTKLFAMVLGLLRENEI